MNQRSLGHIKVPLKRIHLELTNVCDFNCTFCPKSIMKRKYGYMNTNLAKRLITEIKNEGMAEKITFHVMGEPTLHPDFFNILDHAQAMDMPVGLTTNGSGLGNEVGQRLLDYQLHQVDVSFQTPDEKSFTLRKAKGLNFNQYRDGFLSFFAAYHQQHPDTIFKFRFLNTTIKQKSIENMTGPVEVTSGSKQLRQLFTDWVGRVYDLMDVPDSRRTKAMDKINKLVSYKWNVVEIMPNMFFETYILKDWGHGFDNDKIKDAWGGYCFGMRDHFAVLHNGDVSLCCIDYDGQTAFTNVTDTTLTKALSSDKLGQIMDGFKSFRLVDPYCKRCLGSKSFLSWLTKPVAGVVGLTLLKPIFYKQTRLFDASEWD